MMETGIKKDRMHIEKRIWDYLMVCPVLGTVFLFFYIKTASEDVVYSDYIRLINSYLPDTLSPDTAQAVESEQLSFIERLRLFFQQLKQVLEKLFAGLKKD